MCPNGWSDEDESGWIWLYPENIERLIARLQFWLGSYRRCAREDAKKIPAPNWGGLLAEGIKENHSEA